MLEQSSSLLNGYSWAFQESGAPQREWRPTKRVAPHKESGAPQREWRPTKRVAPHKDLEVALKHQLLLMIK